MTSQTDILLCNGAAGYAVAGVAGGIGLVVVGFGVDDDCGTAVAEERVGAVAESHIIVLPAEPVGFALRIDLEILHVAGVVAFGILQSVFFTVGIEVRAGGLEVGGIALGVLMEVDGMLPGREIVQMHVDAHA
jgi:hypothetical protein